MKDWARERHDLFHKRVIYRPGLDNALIAKVVAAGGRIPHPPEDHGFMYDRGFEDIDGHLWNLIWTALGI
ncbi:VOC family protein [Andreprevotia lacus]|jgi:hypothetical protein|uniref:VOC family protein n=1 Tax=Andreprevotia lacus TaxID=1121000 RepID=UPI001C3857F9